MKKFLGLLLLLSTTVFAADIKISQLPLGSGASVGVNDSFPYVQASNATTKRLTIYDLVNVPLFVSTYAPIANPTFTGTVTAPLFVGALTGTASGNTTISPVNHGVVVSSATNALSPITPDASTTKVLVSGGASANPAWGTVSLTAAVSGVLPIANGGTNNGSLSVTGGTVYYGDGSKVLGLANGSAGQMFQSAGGTSAPAWTTATYPSTATGTGTILRANGTNWVATTATYPTTTTANQILYSSAANTVGEITTAATSALVTNSSSVPSFTSGSTANRLLRTNGTAITFAQAALTTDVTGTLPIANGGTNNGSLDVTGGNVFYADGSKIVGLANGTSGQVLVSAGGTSAPAWTTLAAKTTGEVFMTAKTSCPTGSIAADGSSLLRSGGTSCGGGSCAALFSAISTTYGTVDGTHFTLPDMRGVFPRGAGTQTISAISYTGTQGTTQGDQFQGHLHNVNSLPETTTTAASGTRFVHGNGGDTASINFNALWQPAPVTDGTNGTPRYGSETRPANISLLYCIVY